MRPDALAAASAGEEQCRGQGTLMGFGGSVMSKGGASQQVEAAGERNKFDLRQNRFLLNIDVGFFMLREERGFRSPRGEPT